MKTNAIAFLFLILAANVVGQNSPISYNEFLEARADAQQKSNQTPHRIENVDKTYENGRLVKTDLYVWDYESTNRVRTYHKATDVNGKSSTRESISIDTVIYERENERVWTRREIKSDSSQIYSGGMSGLYHAIVSRVNVDGAYVSLYEGILVDKQPTWMLYEEDRVWINDKGLIVKSEHVSGSMLPRQENHKSEYKYAYDNKIKVTAPIR